MNPLKKIYCRIFQTAFKLALPLLPYRNPKILGSVKEIPALLEKKNCNTVLLITDGGIRKLGLTERLEKALADAGIPCIVYDRTVANPTTANVEEALNLYLSNNCQAIIGFGGGSSMELRQGRRCPAACPKRVSPKWKESSKSAISCPFSSPFPLPQAPAARPLWLPSSPTIKPTQISHQRLFPDSGLRGAGPEGDT